MSCWGEGGRMRLIDADKIDPSDVFIGASEFAIDIRVGVRDLIDLQPTVDPVKHGIWLYDSVCDCFFCSQCDKVATPTVNRNLQRFVFCPNCGAKMDL